jgi:hypothetical protein
MNQFPQFFIIFHNQKSKDDVVNERCENYDDSYKCELPP